MIEIKDSKECCGCSGCVQRCPKSCISFDEDSEGFRYPVVNKDICIECGLCEKVCPILNPYESVNPATAFGAKNRDLKIRLESSSGGVFFQLASHIVKLGGIVFGAVFDENFEVRHTSASTTADLYGMMRSKYMQSRISDTYAEAERHLKSGKPVLYVGAPCQIAGLHRYLRKGYDNLLTLDFVCHGVPSPMVWRKYLREISEKHFGGGQVTGINFREKEGFGAKNFGIRITGTDLSGKVRQLDRSVYNDLYMKTFLKDFILRPSCYDCRFKSGKSNADFTVGDFWSLTRVDAPYDDDNGVSLVMIKTQKAEQILRELDLEIREYPFEAAIQSSVLYRICPPEPKKRRNLFKDIQEGRSILEVLASYTYENPLKRGMAKARKLSRKVLEKAKRIAGRCRKP